VIGGAVAAGSGGPVVLDDCNFHECVNLADFEASRSLSFFPPDGEFVVLNYRVTQVVAAPASFFAQAAFCALFC
jgi:AP-4 complex subunit mu-1